jgi:non-heme chloroperoxidase
MAEQVDLSEKVKTCFAVYSSELRGNSAMQLIKRYARVSPDLELYYEEAGAGAPIIFNPGWIGTTEFFHPQLAHFSKHYRAISYDPRSHGRLSNTLENNNYLQHGADLAAFIESLGLKDVILVAHSWGCHDVYAYLRSYGTENVKAIVFIDSTPKYIVDRDADWGLIKSPNDMKAYVHELSYDRANMTREFFQSMVTRPMTEEEKDWFVDQTLKTPTYVALLLGFDGNLPDFTNEARMIDGKIPVLNVLAEPGWYEGWTESGRAWLRENAPHSEVVAFGLHMMFWEFPDKFNAVVDAFLSKI